LLAGRYLELANIATTGAMTKTPTTKTSPIKALRTFASRHRERAETGDSGAG
jgi:hypothetical protein